MRIPVALIGTLISLGPVFALMARLPIGMLYNRGNARCWFPPLSWRWALTNYLYSFADDSWSFALVHRLNGFAYSAVTTLYMAFYVDSLAPDENRNHAMGYYVGSLGVGYSTGNFLGGLIADHWGYAWTFQLGALLSSVSVGSPVVFAGRADDGAPQGKRRSGKLTSEESSKLCSNPNWRRWSWWRCF